MSHIVFFRTRLNPLTSQKDLSALPGQTYDNPTGVRLEVDPTWRVAAPLDVRSHYEEGTVFAVSVLTAMTSRKTYSVADPRPLVEITKVVSPDTPPTTEDQMLFEEYRKAHPGFESEEDEPEGEGLFAASAVAPKETVLDIINRDYPCPDVDIDGFYVKKDHWVELVRNAKFRQQPTLLTGPTGTGKTELVMLLGRVLGLPVHIYEMGAMHDPEAQLLGQQALVNGEKGSVTTFQYSRFTEDIQQPGIILFDEINRAPASCHNILFPLLDRRRTLTVEKADDPGKRIMRVHPECVFFATANLGGIYTGAEELDAAFANRFKKIELDYLPEAEEVKLIVDRTHIPEKIAQRISACCRSVRELFEDGKVSRPLSTRESLLAAEYVEDGWGVKDAMSTVFLPLFDGEGKTASERATVLGKISLC